jgi:hypothetical protein
MAKRGLSHSWGHPFPGATEAEMFSAFQTVQASELALESSSCSLQVAPPAPSSQFTSRHGLQGQQSNPAVEGSSCKLINFNCSPSLEPQNCPFIFPFEMPTSQKDTGLPLVFDTQPDHQLNRFVVDSSAEVNGSTSSRSQDSSTDIWQWLQHEQQWLGSCREDQLPFWSGCRFFRGVEVQRTLGVIPQPSCCPDWAATLGQSLSTTDWGNEVLLLS